MNADHAVPDEHEQLTDAMSSAGLFSTFADASAQAKELAEANDCESHLVRRGDQWEVFFEVDEDKMDAAAWNQIKKDDHREDELAREYELSCNCGSFFCPECGG